MTLLFQLSTFPSSVAIFQHHQRMEFTFHNSYVILELVPRIVIFLDRDQLITQKLLNHIYIVKANKSLVGDKRKEIFNKEKIHCLPHCHLRYGYFATANQIVMTTVEFLFIGLDYIYMNNMTDAYFIRSKNC
jgi:hypothetical protein